MCTVHVGIRHDYYLVVIQLLDVEIVAVALHEAAAESIDESLDLGVLEHLADRNLFNIKDLTAKRKYRLILSVSG